LKYKQITAQKEISQGKRILNFVIIDITDLLLRPREKSFF